MSGYLNCIGHCHSLIWHPKGKEISAPDEMCENFLRHILWPFAALSQCFSTVGNFAPQVYLVMSPDFSGSHNWGVLLARKPANHPAGHSSAPTAKGYLPLHVSSAKAKRCLLLLSFRVFCEAFLGPSPSRQDSLPELCGPSISSLSLNLFWHESVHKFWNYTAWISFSVLSPCVILGTSFNFSDGLFLICRRGNVQCWED